MTKNELLLLGFEKEWYRDSYWVKSLLSIFRVGNNIKEHYIVRPDENGYFIYEDEKLDKKIYLVDAKDTTKPVFRVGETVTVKAGTFPNYDKDFLTSAGCLIQNYLMTQGPFKGKVPYLNKEGFGPKDVEKYFISKWKRSVDDVNENNPAGEGEVFTEEFLVYCENTLQLTEYTQTVVPSLTEKAIRTNPMVEKRRKELYDEYKEQVHDPVIAAKIDAELEKIDIEYMKDDKSFGFLKVNKSKAFGNTRKRLNNHFGTPQGLDGKQQKFIERPLKDGVDIMRLSEYTNDAYSGSIGRGLETQKGGVQVKNAVRSAANLKVADNEDCGTHYGKMVKMEDDIEGNLKYINYWYINEKGVNVKITEEHIPQITGKVLNMRSPDKCINKRNSYCLRCAGPNLSMYKNGIAMINAIPGTAIMLSSMKSMHSSVVKTSKWHIDLIS